ncbi:MAG: BRcat domain-containing protein [Ruminococcus sp.]
MDGFFGKIQRFMVGRNGFDKLSGFLFIVYASLVVISFFLMIFIRSFIFSLVIYIVEVLLAGLIVFRVLSKNLYRRQRENLTYMKLEASVKNFFIRQKNRIRDFKTHRYIKCKNCKVFLRVKKNKGKHTVRCPKCKKEFNVNIRF